jgi:DNA gyrase subunit A
MVGALQVSTDDEIMLMSQAGVLVRTPVKDISVVGRNTQGVRLIRLEEGDQLSGLERIAEGAAAADGEAAPEGEAALEGEVTANGDGAGATAPDDGTDDAAPDDTAGGNTPDTEA